MKTLRVLNGLVGVVLAASVLFGVMDIALFVVPDLLLSAFLIAAAVLPRGLAERGLLGACGFATGVFTVATARYVLDGKAVNPPLIIMLAVVATTALVLIIRPRRLFKNSV